MSAAHAMEKLQQGLQVIREKLRRFIRKRILLDFFFIFSSFVFIPQQFFHYSIPSVLSSKNYLISR